MSIECPYCLSLIDDTHQFVTCESCGARYHQECWNDNGGCCVGNCSQLVKQLEVDIQPEQGELLVLTKESVESAIQHKATQNWNPCLRCGRHIPEGDLYCQSCKPEREESQDIKNLGPLLVTLFFVAVAVFWLIYVSTMPNESRETPPSPRQEDRR